MITKQGVVVKRSGDKTVKVVVHSYRPHPKYKKQYRVSKNFLAHDENNEFNVGDAVSLVQSKPLSKRKSWTALAPTAQ